MAIAALVIAVCALLVAGWSAWATHQMSRIERERRRSEQRPMFVIRFTSYAGQDGFEFVNQGPLDYDEVNYRIVRGDEGEPPISGLVENGTAHRKGSLGRMTLGQPRFRAVRRSGDGTGGTVRFRMSCKTGDNEWTVLAEGEVPPEARVNVW